MPLAEITNQYSNDVTVLVVDAAAASGYGGWDAFEDEILEAPSLIEVNKSAAWIVGVGGCGASDVLSLPDGGFVLTELFPPEGGLTAAARAAYEGVAVQTPLRPGAKVLGELQVTSGALAIVIAQTPVTAEDVEGIALDDLQEPLLMGEDDILFLPTENGPFRIEIDEPQGEQHELRGEWGTLVNRVFLRPIR